LVSALFVLLAISCGKRREDGARDSRGSAGTPLGTAEEQRESLASNRERSVCPASLVGKWANVIYFHPGYPAYISLVSITKDGICHDMCLQFISAEDPLADEDEWPPDDPAPPVGVKLDYYEIHQIDLETGWEEWAPDLAYNRRWSLKNGTLVKTTDTFAAGEEVEFDSVDPPSDAVRVDTKREAGSALVGTWLNFICQGNDGCPTTIWVVAIEKNGQLRMGTVMISPPEGINYNHVLFHPVGATIESWEKAEIDLATGEQKLTKTDKESGVLSIRWGIFHGELWYDTDTVVCGEGMSFSRIYDVGERKR
jgi:hypothetical protein